VNLRKRTAQSQTTSMGDFRRERSPQPINEKGKKTPMKDVTPSFSWGQSMIGQPSKEKAGFMLLLTLFVEGEKNRIILSK